MAKRRSLLDLEHLSTDEITGLLRLARRMQSGRPRPLLRNQRVALLFYESSTRTRVTIVGDIFHSRVARSAVQVLTKFGAQVCLCGPPELCPEMATSLAKNITVSRHLEPAIRGVDVVMMLRIQKERLAGLNLDLPAY